MGIIAWIIFGGLVGWIATLVMDKDASYGIMGNILVGIVGAVVGGFLFSLVGGYQVTGFNIGSVVVGILGSILVLWLLGMVRRSA